LTGAGNLVAGNTIITADLRHPRSVDPHLTRMYLGTLGFESTEKWILTDTS
jgi:hypothetical protein